MTKLILVILALFGLPPQIHAQTEWIIKEGKNPAHVLTTEITGSKITGFTRNQALVDYVGESKFKMIKSMSKLKYAEIIHFTAEFEKVSNTFSGKYNYLFSEKKLEGRILGDSIYLTLVTDGAPDELLTGMKKHAGFIRKDYRAIVSGILQLTESNLYDPAFFQSKAWGSFKETLQLNSLKMADDLELQIGILAIAKDFPFTHYSVARTAVSQTAGNFMLSGLDSVTGLLTISSFSGTEREMDSIVGLIGRYGYKNLVIDLRNNGGGDNEAVAPLLAFLMDKERIVGIFPNKNWYKENDHPPAKEDYPKFNRFSSGTLRDFYAEAEKGYGSFLLSIPSKRHFEGKVFLIVNKSTASTSEIFALALKETGLATIVGQATMGAALSGKKFELDNNVSIFIPQNDYISYSGYRIDKKGVKPDITVKAGDEIQYILKNLIEKQ